MSTQTILAPSPPLCWRGRLARLRQPWRPFAVPGTLAERVRRAEIDGTSFAFRARCLAIAVMSVWIVVAIQFPRDVYYLAIAALFFALGLVPFLFRRHRRAEWIKMGFVVLDVVLITAAIMVPPPFGLSVDWPVQTRVKGQEYLFLLLLLGEAALTYSPFMVVWTGAAVATVWSVGMWMVYSLPSTMRVADVQFAPPYDLAEVLRFISEPTYVGVMQWRLQIVATLLFSVLIALAVWRARRSLIAHAETETLRSELSRYVSPDVADAMAARGVTGFGEPTTRPVAVLFADIVGFTAMTETLSPERTFALLRSFQTRACRVVFAHGGTLDKYLGDGFMATFGGLDDQDNASERALACAFALRDEIDRWSRKRTRTGLQSISVAVGVHCGDVTVGNLGAERRIEFTVVGDVVNVASRLEDLTRELDGQIIASAACVTAAGPGLAARFDRSMEVGLRGRDRRMSVYVADRPGVPS